jgi:hypothetical protein
MYKYEFTVKLTALNGQHYFRTESFDLAEEPTKETIAALQQKIATSYWHMGLIQLRTEVANAHISIHSRVLMEVKVFEGKYVKTSESTT